MKSLITFAIAVIAAGPVSGARDIPDSLSARIEKRATQHPSELIYLQPSKDVYETGEDLWLKAYLLDAQTFGLSDRSRTLYLQMVNARDSVVWQERYGVKDGIAPGHIYVDGKLPEGDYWMEGYTKHSFHKDDPTGILPGRKVKIVKTIVNNWSPRRQRDSTYRFEMFPEGGNLVADISAKLAFKATDGKGNPISATGMLYDGEKPLLEVRSTHDGMGAVCFTPRAEGRYRIELKNGNAYSLPPIHSEGMVLRLYKQTPEALDFIVAQSSGRPEQQVYLTGQMRGVVYCLASAMLKDDQRITIPLSNFSDQGIVEFTLWNEALEPVAERLAYVHPQKKLCITLHPDKTSYALREKVTLQVKTADEAGKPVRAHLGISVCDEAYRNPSSPVNILTHCYLSSQIRGNIYNPEYYFDDGNEDRAEALDLLLLTQGWRRYVWNTENRGEPFLTDEITGLQTIKNKKKEKFQGAEQLVRAYDPNGNSEFVAVDTTGVFSVGPEVMRLLTGGYIYLKPMLEQENRPKLSIVDPYPAIAASRSGRQRFYTHKDTIERNLFAAVKERDSTILIDQVTVTKKAMKPVKNKFMGHLDSLEQMDMGPWVCQHGFLENYKEGYSHLVGPPGMVTQCAKSHFCLDTINVRRKPVIGQAYRIVKYEPMGDGRYGLVDINRNVMYMGPLYTEEELLEMNNIKRTKGYYPVREFYKPDSVEMQVSVPDVRNTLLWAPSVVTDEKGETTLTFYCSDINSAFTATAEGVDGIGLLGSAQCQFRVMRPIGPEQSEKDDSLSRDAIGGGFVAIPRK